MQFRFHVYQQPNAGGRTEPRLSDAALEHQYELLVPTLRRYCDARGLNVVAMAESFDPELQGRIITVRGTGLRKAQAETLMGEYLHYLNRLVRDLHLVAGLLE